MFSQLKYENKNTRHILEKLYVLDFQSVASALVQITAALGKTDILLTSRFSICNILPLSL